MFNGEGDLKNELCPRPHHNGESVLAQECSLFNAAFLKWSFSQSFLVRVAVPLRVASARQSQQMGCSMKL